MNAKKTQIGGSVALQKVVRLMRKGLFQIMGVAFGAVYTSPLPLSLRRGERGEVSIDAYLQANSQTFV
jgi:hypothetical protein